LGNDIRHHVDDHIPTVGSLMVLLMATVWYCRSGQGQRDSGENAELHDGREDDDSLSNASCVLTVLPSSGVS
jgi:hypothetical protein